MSNSTDESATTVFVSGCFDLLHSGHLTFLESAARYGRLLVAVGSDATIRGLKGRLPECCETERLRMVQAFKCVHTAFIATGSGLLDFELELRTLRPNLFLVNDDGHHAAKESLCHELGIRYTLLRREPSPGVPVRSSTGLRSKSRIPYRIDLAGGWLDQPLVSKHQAGRVIVASIEPQAVFQDLSGLATSTRTTATRLWGSRLPAGDPVELGKILFACENPPGTKHISGSQDALGIVMPGINSLYYQGEYWPSKMESIHDDGLSTWLDSHLSLLPLVRRPDNFDVMQDASVDETRAQRLAAAADAAWQAILEKDEVQLGAAMTASLNAQLAMFPSMMTAEARRTLSSLGPHVLGAKLTGAGGGGYLLVLANRPPQGALGLHICRAGL